MSAPVASTTSCPASRAAYMSGSIGKTCPTSGLAVKSILMTVSEPHRGPDRQSVATTEICAPPTGEAPPPQRIGAGRSFSVAVSTRFRPPRLAR